MAGRPRRCWNAAAACGRVGTTTSSWTIDLYSAAAPCSRLTLATAQDLISPGHSAAALLAHLASDDTASSGTSALPPPEPDFAEAIRIRGAAHAFEGKVFNVIASCALDEQAMAEVAGENDRIRKLLTAKPAASMILNPQGQAVAGPLLGREGILYADCDLGQEIVAKQIHDIVGTYQRSDIFQLLVDTRRHTPLRPDPSAGRDG